MKKFWALLPLCILLIMSTALAATFPDLPEGHWAFSSVEKMRNDGRVNGFPDGEFKPDELVTRWQFAKMAGGDPDAMTDPDRPATRDEAIDYLWNRAGKPSEVAPMAVTLGSKNPDAVAWGYTRGVMQGDDGLNLRLSSTLTRAEAATLIVRAEQELPYVNFKDVVSPVILERVWNSMKTGVAYDPYATMTGGQVAHLALQIGYERNTMSYITIKNLPDFQGEYAMDVQLVAEECLGLEKANTAFMDNPISVQDAVTLLSFYSMRQAVGAINVNPNLSYSDTKAVSGNAKMALQFARTNGILLYSDDKLNAEAQATVKDLACILTQLDEVVGLTKTLGTVHETKFLKEEYSWPSNAADYDYILSEVPVAVYETPMYDSAVAAGNTEVGRAFGNAFVGFLKGISSTFPKDVKVAWTFYPSLLVRDTNDMVIRVKLEILENPNGLTLNQLFKNNTFAETYSGKEFFVDISVGTGAMDVVLDATKYTAIRAF